VAFLIRLIPPRPSFPQDMDERESEKVDEHASYWRGLLERDFCVAYGPVDDPAGPWGLGVLKVDEEADARRLVDEDPIVAAGIFGYELMPMFSLYSAD
jgi:hypothetical protein